MNNEEDEDYYDEDLTDDYQFIDDMPEDILRDFCKQVLYNYTLLCTFVVENGKEEVRDTHNSP